MGQVPMRALARQTVDGRALRAGDPFNAASESDADDFEAVNMAKREKKPAAPAPSPAPTPAPPAASEVESRDMHAEDGEDDKSDDKGVASSKQPPRGQYNRRDMKPRR